MWRKMVIRQPTLRRTLPQQEPTSQHQALAQLLLPVRPRSLGSLLSFWAPISHGSTTRAACFFQHVSATTWLRAS
jgi:hypothetical protein